MALGMLDYPQKSVGSIQKYKKITQRFGYDHENRSGEPKTTIFCVLQGTSPSSFVMIQQPEEEAGRYGCRSVIKDPKDLIARDGGCWTMNEFSCYDSEVCSNGNSR